MPQPAHGLAGRSRVRAEKIVGSHYQGRQLGNTPVKIDPVSANQVLRSGLDHCTDLSVLIITYVDRSCRMRGRRRNYERPLITSALS